MSEKDYRVSVVTPFHNVDIKMFRYAYQSLQKQTLGFDNIQWIVVLHNTKMEYKSAVHELLDGHGNVILKELDNDIHTPSSPRNFGMKFATADRIPLFHQQQFSGAIHGGKIRRNTGVLCCRFHEDL